MRASLLLILTGKGWPNMPIFMRSLEFESLHESPRRLGGISEHS